MHIPDGFIDIPTSTAFAALAATGVALSIKGAKSTLDEKTAPLAGLTATFIFAVQMLNFPVAAGTSGHLLGGALAAVLVGPYAATLSLTVVLLMQGLLFADGGLTAIGLNVFNMAIIGVWAGSGAFLLLASSENSAVFKVCYNAICRVSWITFSSSSSRRICIAICNRS